MYDLEKLIKDYEQSKPLEFVFFWGHQTRDDGKITASCLSQWWPASFEVKGISYLSAEHYMMAEKARLFNDDASLEAIIQVSSPAQAKKLGREVQSFERDWWDAHKMDIVIEGNRHKFSQNKQLQDYLLFTGNAILVEASPVDKIWGIGLAEDASTQSI